MAQSPPSKLRQSQKSRFYEDTAHPWHIEMLSETPAHPAWRCGIFVVHGIGSQSLAQVAATLRSGFDDAWAAIDRAAPKTDPRVLTPPYVLDGWWANYQDVEKTFEDHWKGFEPRQQVFFRELWKQRTGRPLGTVFWFIKQQLRLLHPRTLLKLGPVAYALYLFIQVVSPFTLFAIYFFKRGLVDGFLTDVRLYAEPKGVTERAIVQRIDARVGDLFLQMIGLDRDFRELANDRCIKASGRPLRFERVVWVAHSLGSVISYNVLSDLFARAADLESSGDDRQRMGVAHFRKSLRRFITMGSPLDKFAFLFDNAVRPWPETPRSKLLDGGETFEGRKGREWWVNYYHVLDPISGSLSHPTITGNQRGPVSLHLRSLFKFPGAAHMAYWTDVDVLRYVFGRTYGKKYLCDDTPAKESPFLNRLYAVTGLAVWTVILVGGAWLIVFEAIPRLLARLAAYF